MAPLPRSSAGLCNTRAAIRHGRRPFDLRATEGVINDTTGCLFLVVAACVAVLTAPAAFARAAHQSGTSVTVQEAMPSEFSYTLSTKSVKHGSITFKVTNTSKSGLAHDFKLCTSPTTSSALANSCTGKGTAALGMGQSATLTVTIAKPGKYEYLCTVPGHAAGGMKGVLTVT